MSGQSRCISDEDNVVYPQSGNCISDLQCVDQDELESPETAEGYEATHTDITRRCKVAGLNMETGGNCDDNSMCDIENGFSCKTSNEEDHVLAQWSAVYAGGGEGQTVWDMISVNTCFKHNFPENLPSQYQIYYHWLAPGRCWALPMSLAVET